MSGGDQELYNNVRCQRVHFPGQDCVRQKRVIHCDRGPVEILSIAKKEKRGIYLLQCQ